MAQPSSVHDYVNARFREAFGEPDNSLGKDDHWRLQGSSSNLPINVLLNGTRDIPVLWVFDADDGGDGVFNTALTDKDQVDDVIMQIQDRLQRAARAS